MIKKSIIDRGRLPMQFPTHQHPAQFWEQLGRAVATFGFLEEILGGAIFAFTATRKYSSEEIDAAYQGWLSKLERALTDPLANLVEAYGKAVRDNPDSTIQNIDELVESLKAASKIRNVICHGSWRTPDTEGRSIPFFVNKNKEKFETLIDIAFLEQTQRHVAELACDVIDSVTHMGWQFPGMLGPGKPIC